MVGYICTHCGQATPHPIIFGRGRQRVFAFIWDNPGCTVQDILRGLQISPRSLRNSLNNIRTALHKRGIYRMVKTPVRPLETETCHYKIVNY